MGEMRIRFENLTKKDKKFWKEIERKGEVVFKV